MNPVNAWVDAAECMRLAELLLVSPAKTMQSSEDAGFGGDFIGFATQKSQQIPASTPVSQSISHMPQIAPQPVAVTSTAPPRMAVPLHHPPPQPQLTPPPATLASPFRKVTPPSPVTAASDDSQRGPFLQRMVHFSHLLRQHLAIKGLFILDKEGKVIFDDADHGKLYFMARSLANSTKNTQDELGGIQIRVGSMITLAVIPASTIFGKMTLGLLTENQLSPEIYPKIVNAFQSAIAPPQVP